MPRKKKDETVSILKRILMRSLPIFVITIGAIFLSLRVSDVMIRTETEDCWERLDEATEAMVEKIHIRFSDNLNLLERVADAIVLRVDMDEMDTVLSYLDSVRDATFFERIDILLPDNTLVMQTGEKRSMEGQLPFEDIVLKGTHISGRYVDSYNGKNVIYCATPIMNHGDIEALLIGVIACQMLPELFPVHLYDEAITVFLIDRNNGDILLDNRNDTLGNIAEMNNLTRVKAYAETDFVTEMMSGEKGTVAFYSEYSDGASYMYYMPVEKYDWELALVVEEAFVFENVTVLERVLRMAVATILFLFVISLAWNIFVAANAAKNAERARTAELERLRNEAKSRFLSSISHDIRTPLNGILGMLDIIRHHENDPDMVKTALKKIEVSTRYLETLANDVLDLNEIESGKLELAHEPIHLREFLDDISSLVQARAAEAEVIYFTDITTLPHPEVYGSTVHLQRILINLITNAIKYNRRNGYVRVALAETGFRNGRASYRFTVEDTGIGMTEEFQKTMFHAFEQENAGARTQYRGHGLGLSIVKQLVDKMRGTIEVQSVRDEGSTFTVTLTFPIVERADTPVAVAAASKDIRGARILLAEDNELNREIAQVLLTDAGVTLDSAVNGREAVDLFAASAPYTYDVILMDLMMPDMDGCEATEAIRKMSRPDAAMIPIIAMTASTFTEDVKRCFDAGMNEHIAKPLNMQLLLEMIASNREAYRMMREEMIDA